MNIAIVGGGKASLTLIDCFTHIAYIKIRGVFDLDDNAPGILRARELGIRTFKDVAALSDMPEVETIIELTGSDRVRKALVDGLKPHQHFMSSNAARIMCDFIDVQGHRRAQVMDKLSEEFGNLSSRLRSTEEYIGQSIKRIEDVLRTMEIVTVNARIEAVRAGQSGKAFEVVVQAMQGTLGSIKTALLDIRTASNEWKSTMADLVNTETKLKETV